MQNRYEEGQVAWDIIRKGPERLQSQFAAGYGMVLNLLYSRSLDEAKAFIERSFNTYLSEPPQPYTLTPPRKGSHCYTSLRTLEDDSEEYTHSILAQRDTHLDTGITHLHIDHAVVHIGQSQNLLLRSIPTMYVRHQRDFPLEDSPLM